MRAGSRSWLRFALFASGDFAFNLYWQSITLFLLFYYTDVLGLPIALASTLYVVASLWDGVAGFAVAAWVERRADERIYRRVLIVGAAPLGLAFVLAYLPLGTAALLAAHLLFRTGYAIVNLPYLAMSARVSTASRDRALVAGLRMIAGTIAAVIVAGGTVPLGAWLGTGARTYIGAAMLFAVTGTLVLALVGGTFREAEIPAGAPPPSLGEGLRTLAANRAFVTLAGAMTLMIVAVTILNKSVLYYFKYRLGDVGAGQLALASMMATSAAAIPLWLAIGRRMGARTVWFAASALAVALLAEFAAVDVQRIAATQAFLVAMQVAIVGLNFALWALLPDTIEYGQRATGARVEALTYGVVALLQRVAMALATALFGGTLAHAGFVANAAQASRSLGAMRLTITAIPLAFLAAAAALMWINPLRRGEHARVLAALAGEEELRTPSA